MSELLWKKYRAEEGDQVRDDLIVHYLFLVKKVVRKLLRQFPSHVQEEELYASGVLGLMKAIDKFDVSKEVKFEQYAPLLIKGAIIDELRKLDWIPRSVHQKAQKILGAQDYLQQTLKREATEQELADHLHLSREALLTMQAESRSIILLPLHQESHFEEGPELSEKIADQKSKTALELAYKNECIMLLEQAMDKLSKQEKKVLMLYYYEDKFLKEIGKSLKISESRVSQIHTTALNKLKSSLKKIDRD